MAYEVTMPRLGWTMEEGVFGEWLKQDGDEVQAGDLLFTVEGDKATQEVEVFEGGILHLPSNAPASGDVIPVGALLAYIVQAGESLPAESSHPTQMEGQERQAGVASPTGTAEPAVQGNPATKTVVADGRSAPAISPRARRVAGELGVDWTALSGSGRTGRIVERDVRAAAERMVEPVEVDMSPVARRMAAEAGISLEELAAVRPGGRIQREDVEAAIAARRQPVLADETALQVLPHTRIRQITAHRMAESAHTTAPVTLTTEADATELVALREQLKSSYARRGLAVPSYNDIYIKLAAAALQEHPTLNSSWGEEGLILHGEINISFAVVTEGGLLAPVLRDVSAKSLRMIATEAASLIEGAQQERLSHEAMQGGTFTITNLGMYGIDAFTPIINLPQAAILGIGRIVCKPAVHAGEVVPRQMVALSLTFDHRIVDGAPAARFLNTVREYVSEPILWLTA
ncbi:MAG: dihydrolipoamide acetyltransferase family protein [Caldilineaceae bacterium]|nr:dihydrolipoamide acetyltransferase family protein [Caldilineaceae bacterium]